jgi:hypothetical protein
MGPVDSRKSAYGVILGVATMVVLYAIAHDQYIVRIAPEHFTVYHEPLGTIRNPSLLAAAYAFLASATPGLILGLACFAAGRLGARPKVRVRTILIGAALVILGTELVAAASGLFVWRLGRGILPEFVYPDPALPLVITQTIQIFCYAGSAVFSGLLLLWLRCKRRSAHLAR